MVTGGHSTAHRNLCGVVECSFFYCGGRTGCGARRVLFVECYASSALCRVKVVECWACSPDLVGFGLARLWTIGQNRAKPSKKQPKTSKKQHTPCKKKMQGVWGQPRCKTPQILWRLAPPKTKSNGLTAAPQRKPLRIRFATTLCKRRDSGQSSGSQFLRPRGATTCS